MSEILHIIILYIPYMSCHMKSFMKQINDMFTKHAFSEAFKRFKTSFTGG